MSEQAYIDAPVLEDLHIGFTKPNTIAGLDPQ